VFYPVTFFATGKVTFFTIKFFGIFWHQNCFTLFHIYETENNA